MRRMIRLYSREHESCLGITKLNGKFLHLFGGQPRRIQHDSQRIAPEKLVRENIQGDIGTTHNRFSHRRMKTSHHV